MERTPHVLLIGAGAEALAEEAGVPQRDPGYFVTPARVAQLAAVMEAGATLGWDASAAALTHRRRAQGASRG